MFQMMFTMLKYNFSPPCVQSKTTIKSHFPEEGLNAVLSACLLNHYVQFAELACPMTSGAESG